MRKLVLSLCLVCLGNTLLAQDGREALANSTAGDSSTARTWYGFNPLRLTNTSLPLKDFNHAQLFQDSCLELSIKVNRDGKVTAASIRDSVPSAQSFWMQFCDALIFDRLAPWTSSLSEVSLPLRVCLHQSGKSLEITSAQTTGRFANYELLERSLNLNGITIPKIASFPSFYPVLGSTDSLSQPPVVLLRLGRTGRRKVVSSEIVSSTVPELSYQIEAGGLRAEFSDLSEHTTTSDTVYLCVHALSSGISPIPVWSDSQATKIEWFGFSRVQIVPGVPEPADILTPPLPRFDFRVQSWPQTIGMSYSLTVRIVCDSTGAVTPILERSTSKKLTHILLPRLKSLRFFPAIRVDTRPVSWRGTITLSFLGDGTVEVRPEWLEW